MQINYSYLKISDAVYGKQPDKDHSNAIDRSVWSQLPVNVIFGDGSTLYTTPDINNNQYYSTTAGMQAAVYKDKNTGEIVISYRGTDSLNDIFGADIQIVKQKLDPQFVQAQKFYEAVVAQYCTKRADGTYDTSNVTLTGHSLGGALAQLVGVQNTVKTYTYNAPGMLDLASMICTNYNSSLNYSYITNYAIMNDYVGNLGPMLAIHITSSLYQ